MRSPTDQQDQVEVGAPSIRLIPATVIAGVVAMIAWVPFLCGPLRPDESGLLMIARQWGQGSSLYGDYWVDRPPLLVWLFQLAGHLGSVGTSAEGAQAVGVRLLGMVAAGLSVLATGALAHRLAPGDRSRQLAALVLAVALLSTPLFGFAESTGELLALPFVLGGLLCLVAGWQRPWSRCTFALTLAAGGFAAAGMLVKQNVADVFVFAAVLLFVGARRADRPAARAAAFVLGAVLVTATVLGYALTHGTEPDDLWQAVVLFRFEAWQVLGPDSSPATLPRAGLLLLALIASGAALVLALGVGALTRALRNRNNQDARHGTRQPQHELAWATLALIGWELSSVAFGGGYWLHYLTVLLPGLLLAVLVTPLAGIGRRVLLVGSGYAALASVAVWTAQVVNPPDPSAEARAAEYVRDHAAPGDGIVTAFGRSDIVLASGLDNPYEHFWSLPVRVRDHDLVEFLATLSGPDAPRWVVVSGGSLAAWELQTDDSQRYLEEHYTERADFDGWHVWEREDAPGS